MRSRIKQGALIVASSLILGLSLHTAAAVFSCHSGNSKTYTSEPSGNCTGADLPKISSHQGGAYRLKINKLSSDSEEKAAKPQKTRSKEKSREKAQEQEAKSKNAKSRAKKSDKAAQTSSENE